MNKAEALAALDNGATITHVNFDFLEWMKKENGLYIFEDGYSCTPEDFWRLRTLPSYDDGYEIFKH